MAEQQADVARQRDLKYLVQAADARWTAKPSVLDKPGQKSWESGVDERRIKETLGVDGEASDKRSAGETIQKDKPKDNPWKVKQGNPGEGWQPDAWSPGLSKK